MKSKRFSELPKTLFSNRYQLCIKHYIAKINRTLKIVSIKIKIRSKEKQLDKLFLSEGSEYIPVSRWYSMRRAIKLVNEITELEFKYELL
jgi:hypothetical protein